jgi:hypothetical protein
MEKLNLKNLSIQEIVNALQTQNLQKYDFVIPSRFIEMFNGDLKVVNKDDLDSLTQLLIDTGIAVNDDIIEKQVINLKSLDTLHSQLSSRLDIPKRYYDKMLSSEENIHLLDDNVNHWLSKANKNYLLRTFVDSEKNEGIARAILSDRYNVIDNYDVMLATLDAIRDSGLNVQIESGDITDRKFFMRFTLPDIEVQAPEILKNYRVPKGGNQNNGIITGFVISNSETGYGKFSISPRAVVLACRNGMIFRNDAFEKTHLGVKMDEFSTIDWSEDTRQKNYELVIAQVKDAIKTYASKDYLGAKIHELIEKGNQELENPLDCVKNVTKSLNIPEEKEKNILNYFIQGGDTNAFGVSQALTYYAQHDATPEERYDIEHQSVTILDDIKTFDKAELKVKTSKMSLN